jgi:Xaa-Pro aminopeptidase
VDGVAAYSEIERDLQGRRKRKPPFARVVAEFVKSRGTRRVLVPDDFPLRLAKDLRKFGVRVRPVKDAFFPERVCKGPDEIKSLTAAARVAEVGMARAMAVLKESTIRRDGKLSWQKKLLTSEALRVEIEVAVVRAGGVVRGDTIVACGDQACDPHARGSGPLRANELIILDIFPRSRESGYYGDITRTVVRGKASDAQRMLWRTCLDGQVFALAGLKPGADGGAIHEAVKQRFAEAGFPTEVHDGRWRGFFHGTGHGLGLDLHEVPRFAGAVFAPGMVVTVEPGIYWPGVGGVRHEDVAEITSDGHRVLTRFPKVLEI